ncbi:MAG: hypothetical protein SGARI_000924 [Bacillariaceae sp.]
MAILSDRLVNHSTTVTAMDRLLLTLLLIGCSWCVSGAGADNNGGSIAAAATTNAHWPSSSGQPSSPLLTSSLARKVSNKGITPSSRGPSVLRRGFCVEKISNPTTASLLDPALSVPAGGGSSKKNIESRRPSKKVTSAARVSSKSLTLVTLSLSIVAVLYASRETWLPLMNKETLQQTVLLKLNALNELPKINSYTTYILGMALWECAGLSTIPVETAAGMVFGWDGLLLSGAGKLLGAALAFGLGRNLLHRTVQQQFSENKLLQSMQSTQYPFLTALLIKCGPLPETIKNFGSSSMVDVYSGDDVARLDIQRIVDLFGCGYDHEAGKYRLAG